jgi:Gpi18-like mannosyltransferase
MSYNQKFIKMLTAILIVITLFFSGMTQAQTGQNPVKNGSFEKAGKELPDNWMAPGYGREKDNIKIYVEKNGAFAGNHFVTIEIIKANTGRLIQFVKVQPDRVYKFSCRIKAKVIGQKGKGAFISALNSPGTSRDVKDTAGNWQLQEFLGRTGPEQHEVAAALNFADPENPNTGKASFDDFRVEKVTDIPQGSKVVNLYRDITTENTKPPKKIYPVISVSLLTIVLMLLFPGIFYLLLLQKKFPFFLNSQQAKESLPVKWDFSGLSPQAVFYAFLGASFLLRFLLAPVIEGYPTDISCFQGWAAMAADKGLPDFYLSDAFVDYPPGYIYILYVIGMLRKLFALDFYSPAFITLIKSPAILADILTSLLIFKVAKKETGFASASLLSLFYAFNPAVIFDSTIYGQVDSVFVLLLFVSFLLVYKNKLPGASVVFVIAVLVKPQALIFSPILLFAFIRKQPAAGRIKTFLVSAFFSVVTFVVLLIPFSIKQEPTWIFKLYKGTLSSYPFASLNAFNLFTLFGGNWVSETKTFLIFSYKTWGFIFIVAITAFSALLYFKSRNKSGIFFTAMFIMAAVYVLSSKMHERYLFPAILLALLCYVYTWEKRMLFLFGAFTFTFLVNVAMVLHFILNLSKNGIPNQNLLLKFISLANVCLLIFIIITGIQLYIKHKIKDKPDLTKEI